MTLPADHPYLTDKEWQTGSGELSSIFNGMIPKVEFMLDDDRNDEFMDILSIREPLSEKEQKLLDALPKNEKSGRPSAECTETAGHFWDVQTIAAVFGKDWRRAMRTKMKESAKKNQAADQPQATGALQAMAFYMAKRNIPNATLDQKPTILQSF